MPANDYLPFSVGLNNEIVPQNEYLAAEWRTRGFRPGILENEMINKAMRQSSVMASALAQAVGDQLQVDMLDDGDVATIVARIRTAFSAAGIPFNPNPSQPYPAGSLGAMLVALQSGSGLTQEQLLTLLNQALGPTQLTSQLNNRINLIDAPTTGLVTQVATLTATYGPTAAASTSASQAASSAVTAAQRAQEAAVSAGAAFTSAQTATTQASTATTAAGSASSSANSAQSSASSASGSANAAGTSAQNAANSASTADTRATAATNSAANAASSATTAGTAATAAQTAQTAAASSAGAASTSATAASGSATTAAGSASTANNSAVAAAGSATAAGNSATAAAGSAGTASTQATLAGTRADAAQSSATAAQTSASAASTSAGQASSSATSAAGSSSTAQTAATAAATSATTAGTQATAANTSAGNAATYANNAANSAQAAANTYQATVAATGALTASVQTLQTATSQIDGRVAITEANLVFKTTATRSDGRQVIGGIGLASTANGTVGQSAILLQASTLTFVPDDQPNAPLINLLTVQTVNGQTTLAVPAALIPELSAGRITTGSLRGINVNSSSHTTAGSFLPTAIAAGVTAITLDNASDFPSSGSGMVIDSQNDRDVFTWTAKSGNTLTGIPASGASSILAHSAKATVIPQNAKAMVIDDLTNEMRFFGNRGDGVIEELVSIGSATNEFTDLVILNVGSNATNTGSKIGIRATAYDNTAIFGSSFTNVGVQGYSNVYAGLYGGSFSGSGVVGTSTSSFGGSFSTFSGTGMRSTSVQGFAVDAFSNNHHAIQGSSTNGYGALFHGNSTRANMRLPPLASHPSIGEEGAFVNVNGQLWLFSNGVWRYLQMFNPGDGSGGG